MIFRARILFLLLSMAVVMGSWMGCTARRVPAGQKMVKKVFIVCKVSDVDKYDMYGYVKQKPNRKLLGYNGPNLFHIRKDRGVMKNGAGYPLYLAIHNMVNPEREAKRQKRRDEKFERKNKRRQMKNRPEKKKKRKTVGEVLYSIGEPPVLLDTLTSGRSAQQLEMYLDNKGYFHSEVTDSIAYPTLFRRHFLKKSHDSLNIFGNARKKVIVYYIVKPAQVYTIRRVSWDVQDPNIAYDVFADTAACLVDSGAHYDVDVFDAERDRIVKALRNNGYYQFSRDYVRYSIDTTVGNHQADVKIKIYKRRIPVSDTGYVETSHQRFYVRNITVKTIYNTLQLKNDTARYDTVMVDGIAMLRNTSRETELRYKPDVLTERIFIRNGYLYKQSQFEDTYNQLTALRIFRQVIVEPSVAGGTDQLDVEILLFAIPKQNFTAQVEGTNTGGYLGIGGSFAYQNNNLFRGAELFEFRVKGGTEAQQPLAQTEQVDATDQITFNTIEAGAEVSLNIPRAFFPFNKLPIKKAEGRRTTLLAGYNYQRRVDYDRILLNFSVGYTYKFGRWQRIGIYPLELNVVKVNPRQGLIDLLANGDPLLQYRFTDHLINDLRLTFLHNETGNKKNKWRPYLKCDAEISGLAVYPFMKAIGATPDTFGSYRIAGIPFSHYVRFYADGRIYRDLGDHQQLVIRMAYGVGFPQKNFRTLPLEKSFYGGGANGIRAWEARSLGPGSYNVPADQQFAQFGEVQAEYNIELRFKISKTLSGALFADGGNIWLLPSADAPEEAKFNFGRFINDLAFGPGFGIRYDLSFFIVRLDWGFKVRDPAKPYGERWWQPGS
ncbi:MAG TPA: BamA/TamA family outer membrane protein, partial [Bacteroidia bacterium]|nr:BamA/TamA family outer membrane protein [Bacteroidia bacterium]